MWSGNKTVPWTRGQKLNLARTVAVRLKVGIRGGKPIVLGTERPLGGLDDRASASHLLPGV